LPDIVCATDMNDTSNHAVCKGVIRLTIFAWCTINWNDIET